MAHGTAKCSTPAGVKNPTISTLAFGLHIIYVL